MSQITFKISAPGRLVLSGEHTAMYGKYFLSTSIDRRTKLEFYELSDKEQFIYIRFFDVNLHKRISLKQVRKFFNASYETQGDPISIIHIVKSLITTNGMWSTFKQRFSLKVFFFLFYTIAYTMKLQLKPFRVFVISDIPIGAGLGSSTSFASCVAACFLHWKRLQNGDSSTDFDFQFKETIKDYVILCEKLVQDFESANVDAAVCAHGNMIKSKFINHTEIWVDMYDNVTNLSILLVDTKIFTRKCNQAKQMAKMKKFRKFNYQLTKLEVCATKIEKNLNKIKCATEVFDPCGSNSQKRIWRRLKRCIEHNQNLLRKYKLSNPTAENICLIAKQGGYSGKLTGYRSSFVYILLPLNITNENIKSIETNILSCSELKKCEITHTYINCEGVKIDN